MDKLIKCVLLYCSIVKRGTKEKMVLFEDKIFIVNKNDMKMHKCFVFLVLMPPIIEAPSPNTPHFYDLLQWNY